MGTNIILNNLIEKRIKNLDNMIINLGKEIYSLEQLAEIMSISDECIEEIKKTNLEITKLGFSNYYDEKYENKLKIALEAQKHMLKKINIKKEDLNKNMKEINKKEEIINSYISPKKESIFVDKDL